ncbi:MAG: polyketide synthase dehydratase domain-containing protein [Desulfobacteraceae bacterium]|jgi:phosphopantetheinyl transferase
MGHIPQVNNTDRIPVTITLHDHLADHHFMGTPVLPAVEAMEILAAEALAVDAMVSVELLTQADFKKFLPLDPNREIMEVQAEMHPAADGHLRATLVTRTRSPKAGITRTKDHAAMTFGRTADDAYPTPLDVAAAPEGVCETVAPDKIYRELVPFGPAYRNITAPLWLSDDGALALIQCQDLPCCTGTNHLGSPFVLDAAFHAACVWGQHYHKMVAFPVAIDKRRILRPTAPNRTYYGRIIPRQTDPDLLVFDIWLLDRFGTMCEIVQGVRMRDVSRGRLQPPQWIARKAQDNPLARLQKRCLDLCVIELDAVAAFARQGLSELENQRFQRMQQRRKRSYLGARMALKRLSRKLSDGMPQTPAHAIHTHDADGARPRCASPSNGGSLFCSASHSRRFAAAAAAGAPVGIDVETVTDRAVRCSSIFMSETEQQLLHRTTLGQPQAAVRIWSAKEAVAKAKKIPLAEAWHRTEITAVDADVSRLTIDGRQSSEAVHAVVGDTIFTLFTCR